MKPQGIEYWITRSKDDPRKDWSENDSDWVTDYHNSSTHPHRDELVRIIGKLKPESLLEVGANCGPNLLRLRQEFPDLDLYGIDVSHAALLKAIENELRIVHGSVLDIPYMNKSFDCVLSDAMLLYVSSHDIVRAMKEMDRVARECIVLVEWNGKTPGGTVKSFHWARNYEKLLSTFGFSVEKIKITKDIWPTSKVWIKHGYFYIGRRI